MAKEVWTLAEQKEGELLDISFKLLSAGRRVAAKLEAELAAVLIGDNLGALVSSLSEYGASKVYLLEDIRLAHYQPEYYLSALSELVGEKKPEVILFGATIFGRDIAPRLATKLEVGLISNCTHLEVGSDGLLYGSKPLFGGKVSGTYTSDSKPQLLTLSPDNLEKRRPAQSGEAEVVTFKPKLEGVEAKYKVVSSLSPDPRSLPLEEAQVIDSGGRGVGSKENFKLLEDLADLLGGTIACSRMALDEGWAPRDRLVGSTGSFVSPKAYIACGISGASQHLMGMRDSDFIVSINKDPKAPIFKVSDIAVEGDLLQILPLLIERLKSNGK